MAGSAGPRPKALAPGAAKQPPRRPEARGAPGAPGALRRAAARAAGQDILGGSLRLGAGSSAGPAPRQTLGASPALAPGPPARIAPPTPAAAFAPLGPRPEPGPGGAAAAAGPQRCGGNVLGQERGQRAPPAAPPGPPVCQRRPRRGVPNSGWLLFRTRAAGGAAPLPRTPQGLPPPPVAVRGRILWRTGKTPPAERARWVRGRQHHCRRGHGGPRRAPIAGRPPAGLRGALCGQGPVKLLLCWHAAVPLTPPKATGHAMRPNGGAGLAGPAPSAPPSAPPPALPALATPARPWAPTRRAGRPAGAAGRSGAVAEEASAWKGGVTHCNAWHSTLPPSGWPLVRAAALPSIREAASRARALFLPAVATRRGGRKLWVTCGNATHAPVKVWSNGESELEAAVQCDDALCQVLIRHRLEAGVAHHRGKGFLRMGGEGRGGGAEGAGW
jgi:hypothetical protein